MRPVRGQVRNLMMIWKPHDGRCHPKPGLSTVAVKLHLCKCNNRSCHPTAGTMFCCRWKPTTRKKRDREKRSGKETQESFNAGTVGPGAFPSSPWLALNKLNNTAYRSFHMHDRGSPKPPSHWQRRWDSAHPGAAWTEQASRDMLVRVA